MIEISNEIVLECRGIYHWFGANHVLFDVNFKIIRGEIVALVGPSGCGKSTLLRAIVGTHPPRRGEVIVTSHGKKRGRVVRRPGRARGIVYQQYSIFSFLTAEQNVAIGLMLDQTSIPFRFSRYLRWRRLRKQHLEEAVALLEKLKLADAVKQYPHQMSGGMRQRVAIAQALIMKPEILLLDEPFGALDEATREELQRMLLTLYLDNYRAKQRGEPPPYTILIVTHELNEALYVADRVIALSGFWNWKEKGLPDFPGATVVYDKVAPVYLPEEEKDFEIFVKQRHEIRAAAFDPAVLQEREEFQQFWGEIRTSPGRGALA